MQLTVSSDIALRTLIYLGRKNDFSTIQEIANAYHISKTHLMKVVMILVANNILVSERGRNGGVKLALNPRDITIGTVVRIMENSLDLLACMKSDATPETCPLLPQCRLKKVFHRAQNAFMHELDSSSLADVL